MKTPLPDKLEGLKIALVHDDFTQYGGGESIFLAIKELFPTAAIYTSLVTDEWVRRLGGRRPYTSFMQRLPLKKKLQRAYFLLYPLAFESLDFSDFDLVISSSTRFAQGIITKPETKHICCMHSPGRMFWEPKSYFGEGSKLRDLLSPALAYLRLWDFAAAQRVDQFIANSKHIAGKIKKYYRREAKVVYPFVDLQRFTPQMANGKWQMVNSGSYFLVVNRLTRWKRIDLAIETVLELGLPLKIVGDGPEKKRLKVLAQGRGRERIEFLGWVSGEELAKLYQRCQALIMPQEEDFGIASLETQASGKPVIAYGAGGVLETVIAGKTGEFFYPQTVEALASVLKKFKPETYDPMECRENAERFSKKRFQRGLLKEVIRVVSD